MKQIVRGFSVGLVTAGFILLLAYIFIDDKDEGLDEYSTEEMIQAIETNGYRVITEEEYISYSVIKNQEKAEQSKEEEKEEKKEEVTEEDSEAEDNGEEKNKEKEEKDKKEKPRKVTITIKSGMPSSEISRLLEEEGIIDDARAFTRYLEEHDYVLRVQMGKHELQQGMSFYEVAEAITR